VPLPLKHKKIYIALGSNTGDRQNHLNRALDALRQERGIRLVRETTVIETKPLLVETQPDFLNQIVEIETDHSPDALLAILQRIETEVGRIRRFRYGPREIDLDILAWDGVEIQSETLTLPHPGLTERPFLRKLLSQFNEIPETVAGRMGTESNRTERNIIGGEMRLGIVGGGQLGCMLIERCIPYAIPVHVLDPDPDAPARHITPHFRTGDLLDFDTVYAFGQEVDLITIEIEHVNCDALARLKAEGKTVHPDPELIRLVQDKGLQKQFYREHGFPTAEFILTENRSDTERHAALLPAVHKTRKAGYDGRGVQLLDSADDFPLAFDVPGLLEQKVDFRMELSVITVRNETGTVLNYRPVELLFHGEKNLLDMLVYPARISPSLEAEAVRLARDLTEALGIVGVLAVELFVDSNDNLLINEIAPRPHNSGHHTIEATYCSQYEQHLRAITGLPPGSCDMTFSSVMINLLGEEGYEGVARYENVEDAIAEKGVYLHLYGKKLTRPFRKMGHITVIADSPEASFRTAEKLRKKVRVIA